MGLHTALSVGADSVLVVAWDMPFVNDSLVRMISERAQGAAFAVIPEGPGVSGGVAEKGGRLEPFCAVYTRACLPIVEAALDAGDLRLWRLIDRLPSIVRVPVEDVARAGEAARLFFNVNTAGDLAVAERMAREA